MTRRTTIIIPQSWTPANLSNLKIWVKSDTGVTLVGGKVSQWADQSGNNNHLTQGSASARPTYVANEINGYGAVQFDGIDDYLQSPSFTLNQPETVFIIYKTPVHISSVYVFDGRNPDGGAYFTSAPSPNVYMYAGASFTPIVGIVGSYFLATCIFNGASSKYQRNNFAEESGNAGASSMGGLTLGVYAGFGPYFGNPQIAEVIVMSSVATADERTKMKNYVSSRYGIAM